MRHVVLALLRTYKSFIAPWIPTCCRFQPTCSEYAMEAVRRHGALHGSWLAARRLLRCRPGGGGGEDPVP